MVPQIHESPPRLRAISIRQPHAEAILLGEKRVEYRNRANRVSGPIYIYAANTLDKGCGDEYGIDAATEASLPRGVIVGVVDIEPSDDGDWPLSNPRRLAQPFAPTMRAQPVWFYPWPEGGPIPAKAASQDIAGLIAKGKSGG